MSDYQTFLASKRIEARPMGFAVDPAALNPALFPFQRAITEWSLKRGRAAIFAAVGLGKTPMQIEWAHHVHLHTGGDVLILAPLAVAQQTRREGLKFGRTVTVCRSQEDVRPGVNVTNYEMVEHFDAARFAGVVLDESACLRDYMGIVKRRLVDAFAATPYRLCCTATPAPNDHMELGNHSEFLGVMPAPEMLSRWFINDTNATGVYRLKGHAEADFWRWVTSWAVALRRPSDLGDYSDDGYILPPLTIHQHTVEVDVTADRGDHLFRIPDLSATAIHAEMRRTAPARAAVAAALVNGTPGPWAVWVNTNYEADAVTALLPDALEVRGSDSIAAKEARLGAFSDGSARVILTKASVAGKGLNWQHCHQTAVVGLSYSFEALHQLTGRFHRFGQAHAVDLHIIAASTEGAVKAAVERKMAAHELMMDSLTRAMAGVRDRDTTDLTLTAYRPQEPLRVPGWLRSVA